MDYKYFASLAEEMEIPQDGILTRTLFETDLIKVVLFGFSPGQELSEHTASKPALLHFLKGECSLTLGEDSLDVKEGAWVHMNPGLAHSLKAKTEVTMLLTLLKGVGNH